MGFSLREIMAARPLGLTSVGRNLCAAEHGPAERTAAQSAESLEPAGSSAGPMIIRGVQCHRSDVPPPFSTIVVSAGPKAT